MLDEPFEISILVYESSFLLGIVNETPALDLLFDDLENCAVCKHVDRQDDQRSFAHFLNLFKYALGLLPLLLCNCNFHF